MNGKVDASSRPLRIAIVCDAFSDCVAGSFISTQRFAKLLSSRGHTVIFIAARSPRHPDHDYFEGMRAYRYRSALLPMSEGQVYIAFPTKRQIKEVLDAEAIDIVHAMIPTPSAFTAMRAAREKGIPSVVHSHTQGENLFVHLPQWLPIDAMNRAFYRYLHWLYAKADGIIHPTEFSRQLFGELPIPAHVVSNGVHSSVFSPGAVDDFRGRFGVPVDAKIILFVGRIHPEKDVESLVRAMPVILAQVPKAHAVIVGFGHVLESLKKLAASLGVADAVTFTGYVSNEDIVAANRAGDVFVLPSLCELEGMAVLEACATGLPIVIADSPMSAARFFVDGNGTLFRARDYVDLATKVVEVLSNKEGYEEMSRRSIAIAQKADIHESAGKIETIYRALLRRRQ